MIRVIDWLKAEEIEHNLEAYNNKASICTGVFAPEEIRALYPYSHEISEEFLNNNYDFIEDALIKEIVENDYIICGDTHQSLALPVFKEGYVELSMRKWAEIMEKAWALKHSSRPRFYLVALCDEKERLPRE